MTNATRPLALKLRDHIKAAFLAGVVLLAPASALAQALAETPYASGTDKPFTLSFDRSGRLYVGQFGEDVVWRVPVGGGSAAVFVTGTPGFGLGGIIGPDDALYVPNVDGEIYRYAPGATTPDSQPYATGFGSLLNGLVFDDAGRLYGIATGTPRQISRVAPGGGRASAVCVLPNESYAMTISAAGKPLAISEQYGVIYQCDGNNVSVFADIIDGVNLSLTKDSEGRIYYGLFDGPNIGEIYRIESRGGASTFVAKSQTGVVGLIFKNADLYVGKYYLGTVSRIANVAPSPTPVPTMTEWAMILFAVMLAGGAALHLQRGRQFA